MPCGASEETARRRPVFTSDALVAWLTVTAIVALIGTSSLPHAGRMYDWRAFYAAGALVRFHATDLYNLAAQKVFQDRLVYPTRLVLPFYHPSYEALLYLPFTLLTYRTSYAVYMIWNVFLWLGCYMAAPMPESDHVSRIPRSILVFFSVPIMFCCIEGQNSLLFLFLMCLVWRCLSENRDQAAGVLLALALFKLPLVIAIASLLALKRGKPFLQSFLPAAAAICVLCVAIVGPHGASEWIKLMVGAARSFEQNETAQKALAVYPKAMPSISGLLYACGAHLLPVSLHLALTFAGTAAVAIVSVYTIHRTPDLGTTLAVAICCALLVSPHVFLYDDAVLMLAVLLQKRLHTASIALYFLLPFGLVITLGSNWFFLMAIVPLVFLGTAFIDVKEKVTVGPSLNAELHSAAQPHSC